MKCKVNFGFASEGSGLTFVNVGQDSIRTWEDLKKFDWAKNGRKRSR